MALEGETRWFFCYLWPVLITGSSNELASDTLVFLQRGLAERIAVDVAQVRVNL